MNYTDDEDNTATPTPLPKWARLLILAALATGALVILMRVLRRGGGRAVLAAAAPLVAVGVARRSPAPSPKPIDSFELQTQLREIAAHDRLIPPAWLLLALRKQGVPVNSEQHMARELKKLGLRSEVRTVSGRTERRWYNLTAYGTDA